MKAQGQWLQQRASRRTIAPAGIQARAVHSTPRKCVHHTACARNLRTALKASSAELADTTTAEDIISYVSLKTPTVAPVAAAVASKGARQQQRPSPVSDVNAAPLGLTIYSDLSATFRVWAPHAAGIVLKLHDSTGGSTDVELKCGSDHLWGAALAPGAVSHRQKYELVIYTHDGRELARRDPHAHAAEYDSAVCVVDDPAEYSWTCTDWEAHTHDRLIIYEMHIGSFTPEGTLEAAAARMKHVASCGFTAVQLMPIMEHSDAWGYNPRQFLAVHGAYGTPDQLRLFVDAAHAAGLSVVLDIVLHHGAPELNELWEYDGWGPDGNGGIYHEGAPDTRWGRAMAFWKREVRDYAVAASKSWLRDFHVDGLRFDSANDLPWDLLKELTWTLHDQFPGRWLSAEVTPENPLSVSEVGFDSVWVHSGYFDIIQQHRALGRGHHGGGDWAEGWNLPRLTTAMCIHPGFTSPVQCIKYMTGSHDQVGCAHNGAWYEDYKEIGGQHRYAVDQYGAGRTDGAANAVARLWYGANVGAAGLPMMFMGTEVAQSGWWNADEWHRFNWDNAEDDIGRRMMTAVRALNLLRAKYPALRYGWANSMHMDRANGVMAIERAAENATRILVVVNAGRGWWHETQYGVWVGGGVFRQVFSSQDPEFGGAEGAVCNAARGDIQSHDGMLYINVPAQCTLFFEEV